MKFHLELLALRPKVLGLRLGGLRSTVRSRTKPSRMPPKASLARSWGRSIGTGARRQGTRLPWPRSIDRHISRRKLGRRIARLDAAVRGNVQEAARALGISRATIYRKLGAERC